MPEETKTKNEELPAKLDALVPQALKWSDAQVAKFICELGFPQYEVSFRNNLINGRKLFLMDMSTLPKLGITDFQHMKTICHAIEDLLGISPPTFARSITLPRRDAMDLYLEAKARTGEIADNLTFSKFLEGGQQLQS